MTKEHQKPSDGSQVSEAMERSNEALVRVRRLTEALALLIRRANLLDPQQGEVLLGLAEQVFGAASDWYSAVERLVDECSRHGTLPEPSPCKSKPQGKAAREDVLSRDMMPESRE